jgi:predicted permease
MTDPHPRPPWLGRAIVRLWPLGNRRREVEDDLTELFLKRVRARNRRYAAIRHVLDAASLWKWRQRSDATGDVAHSTSRSFTGALGGLGGDIAFAIRMFARQPGIALMTVAGLSIAIGISTIILTVVNAVTMGTTGIRDPDSVYSLDVFNLTRGRLVGGNSAMQGNWASTDIAPLVRGVSSMELAADSPFTIPTDFRQSADRARTETLAMMPVSGGYFGVLGARAAIGRTLAPADDLPAAPHLVLLSHTLWKLRFDSDPGVVGRTAWLDDMPFTIIGVAERGFVGAHGSKFQTAPAIWVTFASQAAAWTAGQHDANRRAAAEIARLSSDRALDAVGRIRLGALRASLASAPDRWNIPVDVIGRLRPGASVLQAQAELVAMAQAFAAEGRGREQPPSVRLGSIDRMRVEPVLTAIVAAVVGVLIALACSNVANLLLANAAGRQREIGTRLALGASRGRVVRQLLTESMLIGVGAGATGLLLSTWLSPFAARVVPSLELVDLTPDLRVYAVVALITIATGLIAGLGPARYGWRGNLLSALQSERAGSSGASTPARLRSILIAAQATACVVLLVVAALLARSALQAAGFNTGVAIDQLVHVSPNFGRGYDAARKREYLTAALQRIEQLPGVTGAALAAVPPFHHGHATMTLTGSTSGGPSRAQRNEVTADYFDTVGISVLQGRTFSQNEVREQLPVAVISARLARQFWGDASPLGSTLDRVWGPPDTSVGSLQRKPADVRVIGVVSDSMTQIDDYDLPTIYLPLDIANVVSHIVVSTHADPRTVAPTVRREVLAIDPDLTPAVGVPSERLRESRQASQAMAGAASVIGASAQALAVIGLFGVTAFVVGQRRKEISIRLALGATGRDVVRLLVRDSLRPVAIGLVCGLVLAFIAGRLIQRALLGISGHDPLAVVTAVTVLVATAGLAAFIPARHAARIDPAGMLKQD